MRNRIPFLEEVEHNISRDFSFSHVILSVDHVRGGKIPRDISVSVRRLQSPQDSQGPEYCQYSHAIDYKDNIMHTHMK